MLLLEDRPAVRTIPAWLVLLVACAGQFLVVLDISIVNVALPAIRSSLGFDAAGLQWVVNAYTLTGAGFLLLGGRIADMFGRRRVFIAGLLLFSVASLAGGLADTPGVLIAARTLQGLGAAVLSPATLTILTTTFTSGAARSRAIGTWTAVGAAGGAAGGLIGGMLTEYASWRWTLLINVPVGLLVAAVARYAVTETQERTGNRLDVPGAVLVTVGLTALVYGIVQTDAHGWSSADTLLPMVAGVLLLAVFMLVERRTAAPLMPLRLFARREVSAGNLVMLLVGLAGFAMWYFLSLYMQGMLHYSAVRTGAAFLPHTMTIILGAKLAPRLMPRLGVRPLIVIGGVIAVAGFVWQSRITETSGFVTGILLPGVLMCFGSGLMMTPIAATVTSGARASEAGLISGLLNAARQVGGSLGLAVLATIASASAVPVVGYRHAFLASAGAVALAVVLVPLLPRPESRRVTGQ